MIRNKRVVENLSGNEPSRSKVMLQKKNQSLESHKHTQTNTPVSVRLYTHEIVWASKDIKRNC